MVSSSRVRILDAALDILRDPALPNLTLESAARQAGLTKPGLMYHFATKEALLVGVVNHLADRWEHLLAEQLGTDPDTATARERLSAYVRTTLHARFDLVDIAVFLQAHQQQQLAAVWVGRMRRWTTIPDDEPVEVRARLAAARHAADGFWLNTAANTDADDPTDRQATITAITALLED